MAMVFSAYKTTLVQMRFPPMTKKNDFFRHRHGISISLGLDQLNLLLSNKHFPSDLGSGTTPWMSDLSSSAWHMAERVPRADRHFRLRDRAQLGGFGGTHPRAGQAPGGRCGGPMGNVQSRPSAPHRFASLHRSVVAVALGSTRPSARHRSNSIRFGRSAGN